MCGVAGSVTKKSGYDLYLQNLNRGYYSSSVTSIFDNQISVIKKLGKLALEEIPNNALYYLFHSRGPTVETNEFAWSENHPFQYGKVLCAHNGIIENYQKLGGGDFSVDSQVIPYLIDTHLRLGIKGHESISITDALERLHGTFGTWIFMHDSRKIYLARRDITLFYNKTTEFSSSNPGYMIEVPQNTLLKYDVDSFCGGYNAEHCSFDTAGTFLSPKKPKYFIAHE